MWSSHTKKHPLILLLDNVQIHSYLIDEMLKLIIEEQSRLEPYIVIINGASKKEFL